MNNQLKNEAGFTLVEFMIALLITSVIAGTIATMLVFHFDTFESAQEMNNVQYEAQVLLNDITRVAIESEGVYLIKEKNNINNLVDDSMSDGIEPWVIIFIDGSTYHIFANDLDSKLYYLETTTLSVISDFENGLELTTDIINNNNMDIFAVSTTSLVFYPEADGSNYETFGDSYTIQIEATVESGDTDYTGTTQVKFRNK